MAYSENTVGQSTEVDSDVSDSEGHEISVPVAEMLVKGANVVINTFNSYVNLIEKVVHDNDFKGKIEKRLKDDALKKSESESGVEVAHE